MKPPVEHRNESEGSMTIIVLIALTAAIGGIIYVGILNSRRASTKRRHALETRVAFLQYFIAKNGSLPIVATDVLLESGEEAYFSAPAQLAESRAVRYSTGFGAGTRVGRGMGLGGWSSRSVSRNELQPVGEGVLVVTNQRLVFDGNTDNRVVPLDSILSVRAGSGFVEVSSSTRQKSLVFIVGDAEMAQATLLAAKTLAEQPGATINFTAA